MALTPAEQAELAQLEKEVGVESSVGPLEGLGRGLKYSALKASRGIADTAAWLGSDYVGRPLKQWAMSKGLVPSDEQLAQAKQQKEEAGGWGTTGAIAGDVGMQLTPAGMMSKAMQVGGKVAPLMGEIASNVALNTALAPNEEKLDAAKGGAIGAVGGRVLSKALGGPLRNAMTEDARKLVDAGITLPVGQMIAGTGAGPLKRTLTNAEAGLAKIPLLGAPTKYRMSGAIEDYNKQQLNDILEPFGATVSAGGRQGIQEARDVMERTLKEVAPNMYLPNHVGVDLVDNLISGLKAHDATLNDKVAKRIRDVLELEITPHVANGDDVPGEVAYQLGKKFDWYAKEFQSKGSPDSIKLNRAFKTLRDKWFNGMEPVPGADPAYTDIIKELQKSKQRWYNFRDAADMTTEGLFTPSQVIRANKGVAPDEITRAASHIMPKTAPEVNTGLNAVIHKIVTPGGVSGAAALGSYAGLGALGATLPYVAGGAALYTKPVAKYLEKGATPVVNKLLRGNGNLTPEELEFATQLAASQSLRSWRGNKQQGE